MIMIIIIIPITIPLSALYSYCHSTADSCCVCMLTLTSYLADMQDISNDAIGDVCRRLGPCDLQGVGGQHASCEALWGGGQVFSLGHSQTGTGLVGACTVLSDALVDGLIL